MFDEVDFLLDWQQVLNRIENVLSFSVRSLFPVFRD